MLGFGFNDNGTIDLWSDLSNYTTLDQLNELLKLPLPTGKKLVLSQEGTNLTEDYKALGILMTDITNFDTLPANIISEFNKIIRKVNNLDNTNVVITESSLANSDFTPEQFINIINKHNLTDYIRNKNATKNSVVFGIRRIISSPSNQIRASVPVDVQQYHDSIEKYGKIAQANPLNSYDILSFFEQQYNASVGKEDVGIMANGMKVFFALTSYYNDWFNKNPDILTTSDLNHKLYNKTYTFYDISKNENIDFNFNTISDLQISRSQVGQLQELFPNYNKVLSDAALILSGATSAATDNAKELIMAKINANSQLASMHVHMMILGFTLDQIVEIMTSDVMNEVVSKLESNIYESEPYKSVDTAFENMIKEYEATEDPRITTLQSLYNIYQDSRETTALSGILGVNQKRKADTWELYKFLNRFKKLLIIGEDRYFDKNDTLDVRKNKLKEARVASDSVIDYVLDKVEYLGITGKNFDIDLYQSDPEYKQTIKDYYNLLKRTFNVFDVVDTVPHFKQMIEGVYLSHRILKTTSSKYGFIFDHLNSEEINTPRKLTKGSRYFDVKTIQGWLGSPEMDKYTFDVSSLLKQSGINSVELYTDDKAMNDSNFVKTINKNSDFTVSLNSDYGIANFKVLMESVLLPILKNSSNIGEMLRIEQMNNPFGLKTNTIVSSHQLKYLNNPISIARFQEILTEFNSLDERIETKNIIKNNFGESLRWRDLFYIYNLVVNNDLYGDKRLTPLFRDYSKESDSLLNQYLNYVSKFDSGELDILTMDLIDSPEYRNSNQSEQEQLKKDNIELINSNIDFYINNKEGITSNLMKRVTNSDFVLLGNIGDSPSYINVTKQMNEILKNIKLNGFIIDYNC